MEEQINTPSTPPASSIMSKMLSFDSMIGPSLIKFIYYAGLVLIAIYALIVLVGGLGMSRYSAGAGIAGIIGGAVLLILGTVMWRFTCELWILAFKIHDRLGEVRDRLPPR